MVALDTAPVDPSINARREPVMLYSLGLDEAALATATPTPLTFANVTGQLSVYPGLDEVGFLLDTSVVGEEVIRQQFTGPVLLELTMQAQGVTAAETGYVAIVLNPDFASLPTTATVDATQQAVLVETAKQDITVKFLLRDGRGGRDTVATTFAVMVSATDVNGFTINKMDLQCQRYPVVRPSLA